MAITPSADRVRGWKPGARCSITTPTGASCNATGDHRYRTCLAHTSTITGLEMIRTRSAPFIVDVRDDRGMLCSRPGDDHISGALAYDRERGRCCSRAKAVVLATGGVGHAGHQQQLGIHLPMARRWRTVWRPSTMEFPYIPYRHGLAAEREGDSGHGGRPRRGRRLAEQRGCRFREQRCWQPP